MRRHPRRAAVDATAPAAWATDDRTGFVGNHRNLRWQFEYAGTQLVNKRILVYDDAYDTPNRQLGTIILPPDPLPVQNARPESYYIDEQTFRVAQDGTARVLMDGTARLESNLQSGGSYAQTYLAEDNVTPYVAEDGSTPYVSEHT